MKVLQRNAYFAHSENVILGMLAEDDENIRRRAVDKILNCAVKHQQPQIWNHLP